RGLHPALRHQCRVGSRRPGPRPPAPSDARSLDRVSTVARRQTDPMGSEHFDGKAATWDDDPDKVRQSGEVAAAMAATVPPTPGIRLLEYGAGTGLVTIALLDHLTDPVVTLA